MTTEKKIGAGAEFSENRKYRYALWRIWDDSKPLAMCIGLNPSTANESKNDNTINVLIRVLGNLGYGGFYMMNCWAFITPDPKLLETNPMSLSDEYNNKIITITGSLCDTVIFAWGNFEIIRNMGRDKELAEMFPNAKCFGKNANGTPWHPRALSYKGLLDKPELKLYQS